MSQIDELHVSEIIYEYVDALRYLDFLAKQFLSSPFLTFASIIIDHCRYCHCYCCWIWRESIISLICWIYCFQEQRQAALSLIKAFQEEIDCLTRRSKAAETVVIDMCIKFAPVSGKIMSQLTKSISLWMWKKTFESSVRGKFGVLCFHS